MPSRGEGFGFVFLEAMACGVPAIGSKLDGGREALLDGKLGMLVDPTNPAEIRAAILETLERRERRVPDGLEYFSFENFAERANAVTGSLLRGNVP
jgi:glycosyltransferase involved in cell wall biosynthesis